MSLEIITTKLLNDFKLELCVSIQELVKDQKPRVAKYLLKSSDVMDKLHISPVTFESLQFNGIFPYSKIGNLIFYDVLEIEKVWKTAKSVIKAKHDLVSVQETFQ